MKSEKTTGNNKPERINTQSAIYNWTSSWREITTTKKLKNAWN
jgi:hypothetical protein